MNPLLLLGAGIAALVVTKKPTPAATPPTPTANGGPIPLAPSAPPACNAPPAGSKPGPHIYTTFNIGNGAAPVRMGVSGSFITPDGKYYIGPQFKGVPATIGIKPDPCEVFYEGPFTLAQMKVKNYST